MKRFVCVAILLAISISAFAADKAGTSDRAVRNYKQSLRYMFIGQTMVAESVFPVLALTIANIAFAEELINSQQNMTAAVIFESLFIAPVIAGVYIYLKGRSLFKVGSKEDESHLSKLMLYVTKLRMFRVFIGVNSSLTGLGTALFVPGVITTAAWYYGYAPITVLPLMVSGLVCLAISLPMLISSLLMTAWVKEWRLRLSPDMGLSRDKWDHFWENGIRGYTLKLGLKLSL